MTVVEHKTPAERTAFVEAWLAAGGDLDTLAKAARVVRVVR